MNHHQQQNHRHQLSPISLHKALERIWGTPPGWGRLSSVNHTVLGKRFMVVALTFFAIGGLLSMLIRAQLAKKVSATTMKRLPRMVWFTAENCPQPGGVPQMRSRALWRAMGES